MLHPKESGQALYAHKMNPKRIRDLSVKMCKTPKNFRYPDDLDFDVCLDRAPRVQYMKEAISWTSLKLNVSKAKCDSSLGS